MLMIRQLRQILFLVAMLATAVLGDGGEEVEEIFESLYGDEARKVAATRTSKDDVEFSAKLLDAAAAVKDQPLLMSLICMKAYEFGIRSGAGYQTAIEAMDMVIDGVPEQREKCLEKCIVLCQRLYERSRAANRTESGEELIDRMLMLADAKADKQDLDSEAAICRKALTVAKAIRSFSRDEIEERLKEISEFQKVLKRIAILEVRVKAHPEDAKARNRLIVAYVADLDNPAKAAEYLREDADEALKRCVPLAAKAPGELSDELCLELAEWYEGLSKEAAPSGKVAVLMRAKNYYQHFLKRAMEHDPAKGKAILSIKKIDDAIEELTKLPGASSKWNGPWWVIGPFKFEGFEKAYPPQAGIKMKEYRGLTGKPVTWQVLEVRANANGGITKTISESGSVYFVYRNLLCSVKKKLRLRFGSDDGIKVWFNGRLVLSRDVQRGMKWDQEKVDVTFARGINPILIRINNNKSRGGLAFRITDEKNKPIMISERGVLGSKRTARAPRRRRTIRLRRLPGLPGTVVYKKNR
ncbi:MAG: hypothetical protein QGD94_08230 [Planctomycetia bacterium]|nr:hypothetical protein [Planctomycetia bacterium]